MIRNTTKIMMIFLTISMLAGCGDDKEAKKAAGKKAEKEYLCKEFKNC